MTSASGSRATIYDVATHAGVSPATVSRVLNGNTVVTQNLAARVRAAIDDVGYEPSRVARSLRRRSSATWALIISDIGNPFYTAMVRGVEDVAHSNGSSLFLCNSDGDLAKERRYMGVALAERVEGIILTPASEKGTDLSAATKSGTAVVTVDRSVADRTVDFVGVDNARAAREATEHLLQSGFRRIACVVGPTGTTSSEDRRAGYISALKARSIVPADEMILHTNFKRDGGYSALCRLAALDTPPDAVFLGNSLVATGALDLLCDMPRSFPTELGLVTFDDAPWFRFVTPSLSAVVQPTYALGQLAGEVLCERIVHRSAPPMHRILRTHLEVRESSSAATGRGADDTDAPESEVTTFP